MTDLESAKSALEQAAAQIRQALEALPEYKDLKDQVEITSTMKACASSCVKRQMTGSSTAAAPT